MKILSVMLAATLAAFSFSVNAASAQGSSEQPASNGFLVKWKKGVAAKSYTSKNASFKLQRRLAVKDEQIELVSAPKGMITKRALHELMKIPGVDKVEPNYIYSINATVDDPMFDQLWGLENSGNTDINASSAWDITTGSEEVVVAVIDSGIDYSHADLAANMWVNPDEIPNNNIDDDNNGYTDDVYGIDTVNNDADPFDDNEHGTHVMGTIAGVGNNGVGVVGVAQTARVIACKFLDSSGFGDTAGAIECLNYLADLKVNKGINLVATNNSWGGGGASDLLQEAIEKHNELGILFIAAAGNSSSDNDDFPSYPASYDVANVVSVASMDSADNLSNFSSYGATSVDLAAPGSDILSTTPNNNYEIFSGTSMATPHVTGTVVLMASAFPEMSSHGIKSLLLGTTREVNALNGVVATGGTLLAYGENNNGALNCQDNINLRLLSPVLNNNHLSVEIGSEVLIEVAGYNCGMPYNDFTKTVDVTSLGELTLNDAGESGDMTAGDGIFSVSFQIDVSESNLVNFTDERINDFTVAGIVVPTIEQDVYQYIEIEGENLFLSDDAYAVVDLPFEFIGFSGTYNSVTISDNGVLVMGNSPANVPWSNSTLPISGYSGDVLVPFWEDLVHFHDGSGVFTETIGDAPNRRFIVEFRNSYHYFSDSSNPELAMTFQVVFEEETQSVRYNYKDLQSEPSYSNAASATVGYQAGALHQTYSYNQPIIADQASLSVSSASNIEVNPLIFTQLELQGVARPGLSQVFVIEAFNRDTEQFTSVEVDWGQGWQPVVNGITESTFDEAGSYSVVFRAVDGEHQKISIATVVIEPFSDIEQILLDNAQSYALAEILNAPNEYNLLSFEQRDLDIASAEIARQALVIANPTDYGLVSQANSDQAVADAEIARQALVIANPTDYGLVSQANSDQAVANAEIARQALVIANPTDYGLVSQVNSDQAVANAEIARQALVIANPTDYGLVSQANSDQAVADAAAAKQAEIVASPANFGLIATTDSQALIAAAELAKQQAIQSQPQAFGLYPADQLTLVDAAAISALAEGTHLMGSSEAITDLTSVFANANFVWVYQDGEFFGWSANAELMQKVTNSGYQTLTSIAAGQGFWVKK